MAHQWTEQEPELPRPSWYWLSQRLFGGGGQVPATGTAAAVTLFSGLAWAALGLVAWTAAAFRMGPGWASAWASGLAGMPDPAAFGLSLSSRELHLLLAFGAGAGLLCTLGAGGALARGLETAHGLRCRRGLWARVATALVAALVLWLGIAGSWLGALGQLGAPLDPLAGLGDRPWLRWVLAFGAVVASTALLHGVVLRARLRGRSVAWGAGFAASAWLGSQALWVGALLQLLALASAWTVPWVVLAAALSQYTGVFAILLGAELDACIVGEARREACGVVRPLEAPSRMFS